MPEPWVEFLTSLGIGLGTVTAATLRITLILPFPHLTVYAGQDKEGRAPGLPLQLMRRQATAAANVAGANQAARAVAQAALINAPAARAVRASR